MQLLRTLDRLTEAHRGGAVSIGNFDGVHRGHARIAARLIAAAKKVGGPSIAFTFDPHPVRLLRPNEAPPPLTWTDRKAELLGELGVDLVIAYPTDEWLLGLSPSEFFQWTVVEKLGARAMVEGPNFFFGRNRQGTTAVLTELCSANLVSLEIVEPLLAEGDNISSLVSGSRVVSSSRVRAAIHSGDVALAAALLTRPYRIRGMVTHGAGRGGRIGFPTANIDAIDTLLPAPGVYAGVAHVGDEKWPTAVNIGPNPTFGENALKVEAHLIGYEGSLYGQPLEVDFLARLRDVRRFESLEALQQQLRQDIETALNSFHSER
jgi:riboflavin kinase/FMN adenylyltransferase